MPLAVAALLACARAEAAPPWTASDTAAHARGKAPAALPAQVIPSQQQWADRVLYPLWLYAQDLALGDEQTVIGLIDLDYALLVSFKVTVERRLEDGASIVHNFNGSYERVPFGSGSEALEWDALARAASRHPEALRLGVEETAAERMVEISGVLRSAWTRAKARGLAPEQAWEAFLPHWSYMGFRMEGVALGPSIGTRARAQSLKFLRRRLSSEGRGGPGAPQLRERLRETARRVWLLAQGKRHPTQFLLTGGQMREAVRRAYPDLAAGARDRRHQGDRLPWEILLSLTEEEVKPRRRARPRELSASLDPYAAQELAGLLSTLSARGSWDLAPEAPGGLEGPTARPALSKAEAPEPPQAPPLFEDRSASAGFGPPNPADVLATITIGSAWLDYDRDGRPDLYMRLGRLGGRLYRNAGGWRFEDVTAPAGVELPGRGDRAVAADYDNDGWPDLFVLGTFPDGHHLFHNRRDGTFEEVTRKAGLAESPGLAVSALWFDYDLDGRLDLYVVHMGRYRDWVSPWSGDPENGIPNRLYRNNGDGTFTDVTERSGLGDPYWGWAAAAVDADDDGRPDVFVCNLFGPSRLYRNLGGGAFEDVTGPAGISVPAACTGVSVGDFNHDGRMDLFVTGAGPPQDAPPGAGDPAGSEGLYDPREFTGGLNASASSGTCRLYENLGGGRFRDAAARRLPELRGFGWNGFFFDYDLDGWQDLFVVNGLYPDVLFHHDETKQLYRFDPQAGRWAAAPPGNGADFPGVSRGSAFADLDGDGCPDLVATGLHGARLLRNACRVGGRRWLRLVLQGTRSNRDGIGARVRVRSGGLDQYFYYGSEGGGSVSSSSGGLLVGLGERPRADLVEVRWPSGTLQSIPGAEAGRTLQVVEAPARP